MDDIDDAELISTRTPEKPTELSKTFSVLAPSAKSDLPENVIKVLLSHVYFGMTTKEKSIMAKTFTDMGLLFRPVSRQVSICFRRMRDEVVIPFGEVSNCELVNERELVVKLRSDFTRAYYSHPDTYPYKKEPVLLNNDPTNGYFTGVNSLLIRSYHATDFDFLSEHGFKIKNENFNKKKTNEIVDNKKKTNEPVERPIASTSSNGSRQSVDNSIKVSSQQETSSKVMIENYVAVNQKIVSKTKTVTQSFGGRQDSNDQQNRLTSTSQRSQRSQQLQYSQRSSSSSSTTFNSAQNTSNPILSTMSPSNNLDSSTLNSSYSNNKINNRNNNSSAQSSKYTRNISSTFQSSSPQNEPNLQNSIQPKQKIELYLTCTFASERRAFIYPSDGTLYHLHFAIRQRFKKHQWNNTWFKSNQEGSWCPLEDEEDWKNAKLSRKIKSGYIRIEIYFK
ncbi:hypothetical protein F8M41_021896 [Gigaspora margarita]|uniref:Uncharacterized protein n=1 Tax=Gigaspora margarita TaxID=4874 RepID=A0A8H4AG07_GIGMA|nr:hypothetical protein F8M41_021896 [Gigaspora margarita]